MAEAPAEVVSEFESSLEQDAHGLLGDYLRTWQESEEADDAEPESYAAQMYDESKHPRGQPENAGQWASVGDRIAGHVERHRQAVESHAANFRSSDDAKRQAHDDWRQRKPKVVESIRGAGHPDDDARRKAYEGERNKHFDTALAEHKKRQGDARKAAVGTAKDGERQVKKDVKRELMGLADPLSDLAVREYGPGGKALKSAVKSVLDDLVRTHGLEDAFAEAASDLGAASDSSGVRDALRDFRPDAKAKLKEAVDWQLDPRFTGDQFAEGLDGVFTKALQKAEDAETVEESRAILKDATGQDFDPQGATDVSGYLSRFSRGTGGSQYDAWVKDEGKRFAAKVKSTVEHLLGLSAEPPAREVGAKPESYAAIEPPAREVAPIIVNLPAPVVNVTVNPAASELGRRLEMVRGPDGELSGVTVHAEPPPPVAYEVVRDPAGEMLSVQEKKD